MRKYRLVSADFRFMYGPYTVVLSKIRPILVENSKFVINCIWHKHPRERGKCFKTSVIAKKTFYSQACDLVSHWADLLDLLVGWLVGLLTGWSVGNAFAFALFSGLFFTFLLQPNSRQLLLPFIRPYQKSKWHPLKQAIKRASNQTSKQ